MLCLITDMKFEKDGVMNDKAGEEIIKYTSDS